MGLTYITVAVSNPARPRRKKRIRFLVDSGAAYSIVPSKILQELGIEPHRKENFILADGKEIKRRLGNALFIYRGKQGASPVIFGENGDSNLLGVVTLEALGYIFDPIRRELRPMPMVLG